MMIPTEAIPLAEHTVNRPGENRKTEPVGRASATGDELSQAAQKQREYRSRPDEKLPYRESPMQEGENDNAGEERRQGERRRGKMPALLDTRVSQAHRRKTEASKISLKI